MPNTLWIERLDTHAEPFWRVRLGTRGICFRNERAAREFAALLHSRRAWQLERNAEEKGADSRNERPAPAGLSPIPQPSAAAAQHLPGHVLAQLELADRRAVHLVRTVGQAQVRCMAYQ